MGLTRDNQWISDLVSRVSLKKKGWDEIKHPRDGDGQFKDKLGLPSFGLVDPTDEDRKSLKIPPGWTDVKVSSDKTAALQAIGRDSKGRKQSIYSAEHHEKQAAVKFSRIEGLHERMGDIDKRLSDDSSDNDAATAALLIRKMGLRPGSDADTGAEKKAYGATNLRAKHVSVDGDNVKLEFTGKKGVALSLEMKDKELASLLKNRKSGKKGDDRLFDTDEIKLRTYMKDAAPGVKPKDFRTYLATSTAIQKISEFPIPPTY